MNFDLGGGQRYDSPDKLASLMRPGANQWNVVQTYRMVTGANTDPSSRWRWDCTSPDWRDHWVSAVELYCFDDYLYQWPPSIERWVARLAAGTVLRDADSVLVPNEFLRDDLARRFVVIDYDRYSPLAPGMALIKAAGHTPGSQMVFVALESAREYLLIGDATWHMDGVRQVRGKDAPWITEDEPNMTAELSWLNGIMRNEPNVAIVISHDEEPKILAANRLADRFSASAAIVDRELYLRGERFLYCIAAD